MIQTNSNKWYLVPVVTLAVALATQLIERPCHGQDVDTLIASLNDPNADARRDAAIALGNLGDDSDKVVEALMKAVGDDAPRNRLIAVGALRKLVSDPAKLVPLAAKLLADDDQLLASRATETLVIRGADAVPFLIEALKNEQAAYWACIAIEEIGADAAPTLPGLQAILTGTEDGDLRVQALLAVAKLGDAGAQAGPEIVDLLAAPHSDPVKIAAAFAAGMQGTAQAKDALIANTKSSNKMVSMVSIWALAKIFPDNERGTVLAVDTLIANLTDQDPKLRLMAAKGLQLLEPDPEIVAPRLVAVLSEDDPVVAHNLVDAFASLGAPAAARAANALESEKLRGLAVEVLSRLGADAAQAVPQMVEALKASSGEFRQQLQSALANVGPAAASATPELVRSLNDDAPEIRISAMLALANIGEAAADAKADLLAKTQSADSDFEAVAAAWALVKVAPNDAEAVATAVPVLTAGLALEDATVQAEAANALGSLGKTAASAVDSLSTLAADPTAHPSVRQIAADAVAKIKGAGESR